MSGASPAEQALTDLRGHFPRKPTPKSVLEQMKEAEARDALKPMDLLACKIDGYAAGAIEREHRLIDTLLVVIDELRQRVTDLEEGMTGR